MKKFFPLLILLCLALLCTAVGATDTETIEQVVFLSYGATGTGASAEDPIGTLAEAYAVLGDKGGTLVLLNEYAFSTKIDLPAHTGTIKWTSVYSGVDYRTTNSAALKWSGPVRIGLGGPTEIDGFSLVDATAGGVLAANFHDLTIGSDVNTLDGTGTDAAKLYIIGGPNNDATKAALGEEESSTLTINSGSYAVAVAFSRTVSNISHSGTVTMNIGGDTVLTNCYLGANGTNAKGGTTILNISDKAAVTGTLYLASSNATTNGSVTVNATGNATIGAFLRYLSTYFPNGTRTLNYALTASVPSTGYFDNISLIDVGYLTVADRTKENLTLASVDNIDVTAYVTEADGAITLPYPEDLTAFTLILTYADGSAITSYTYSVTVENGVATVTLTGTEAFNGTTVYVKDDGTGSGFTPSNPCGTLEAAHALLPSGGTIVLVGEVTLSAKCTLPSYTGAMTYTSVYEGVDYREDGARLYFPNGITVLLGGEAIFKDIAIHTDTYAYITAGFNPLTFDTGVVITHNEEDVAKTSDSTYGLRLAGGYNNLSLGEVTIDSNPTITLRSGFFRYVHGFSRYSGKTTYTGTANIVVEGTAIVDELIAGATQNDATAANVNLTLSDDACIYNVFVGGQQKTNYLTGTFNFVVNGGDIYELDAINLYTAKNANTIFTYDVNTVPAGFPFFAELAQFTTVQTFCERDNAHNYSEPFASEFDANILLKRCSICNDIRFVGDLPEAIDGNVVFVAEGGLGDGSHPSIPTSDLYAAFKKLETSGGTIVIMNAYTLKTNTKQKLGGAPAFFQEPSHTGAILVTSVYGETDYREQGAKFIFDGDVDYKLGGPVTFDHIVFDATEETTKNTIAARYNPIVIGKDVAMLRDMDDAYALDLIGGYLYFRYTDFTDVKIEDGLIEMVNPARPIEVNPETGDYTVSDPVDIVVSGQTRVLRAEAAAAFKKMFDDMVAAGLQEPTGVAYAWRGYFEQYDGFTKQVGNIRVNYPTYDYQKAHNAVLQSCSLPGASEHHLGYAFDFHDASYGDNAHLQYDKTEEWAWIMQNGHKYGLILRFTKKDTATTGFIYEAWHFRYVGVEHATAIANLNSNGDPVTNAEMLLAPEWCLEDYAGLTLGMYDLDSNVTVNGGTFANVEGGSVGCDDLPLTGESNVTIGEKATIMPEGTTYDVIYFSAGAEGDGLSADSPVGTLAQAYAKLGIDGGTLVWMNEFAINAATEMPAHEGTVTITSVYGDVDYRETNGAALKYAAGVRFAFNGPTVIEHFKIIDANSSGLLCANFNALRVDEDVLTVNASGEAAATLTLIGGGNNNLSVGTLDAGETNTITVNSGMYKQIVAFSGYNTNLSHTGTVNLNIGGDVQITSIVLGAKATGSKGGNTVLTLTENASVGTVYLANGDNTAVTNGTVTVYAKDSSSINAFNHYRSALFATENARTLYYDETATLPENLETYFDTVGSTDTTVYNGDANGDGKISLLDVLRILKAITGDTVSISKAADINKDSTIDILDVILVLQSILKQ